MPQEGTVSPTVLTPEEADAILTDSNISLDTLKPQEIDYGETYNANMDTIRLGRQTIQDRIVHDPMVRVSEINAAMAEAFKQNQLIKGGATENLNFNIKEIKGMGTDQLFELLQSLD